MTTFKEVEEAMGMFGYRFEIFFHKKHDAINIFPPRTRKHIDKIWLRFVCKLSGISLKDLMWHALTDDEFREWNAKQWEAWL